MQGKSLVRIDNNGINVVVCWRCGHTTQSPDPYFAFRSEFLIFACLVRQGSQRISAAAYIPSKLTRKMKASGYGWSTRSSLPKSNMPTLYFIFSYIFLFSVSCFFYFSVLISMPVCLRKNSSENPQKKWQGCPSCNPLQRQPRSPQIGEKYMCRSGSGSAAEPSRDTSSFV